MGFFLKIKEWFSPKENTPLPEEVVLEVVDQEENPPVVELPVEEEEKPLSEEEQQFAQIKQLITSDDMSNHELAAMFMLGLGVAWDEEMYTLISQSAEKMTFWAEKEDNETFLTHFDKLVITPKFFGQYSEIATFAAVLVKFRCIEELQWKAKHYWNQHPVLIAASELPNLKRLYVEDCRMNFLPESLTKAAKLEELYLCNNKLTEMPADLGQLANLRILDLTANELQKCPRSVCDIKRLEVLKLQQNPMIDIEPRMLGRLYRLRDLELPEVVAKFNLENLKDWLPDVDFDKPYWKFDS
jgi:hypothetical protein